MTKQTLLTASFAGTPFRINFEQQKKRAKELLKAFKSKDCLAISRFEKNHPNHPNHQVLSFDQVKLSDAQLVVARELGLSSWPKLKAHVQAMQNESRAIDAQISAPDAQFKTLHIRCGSDLEKTLPAAGFIGDFLEYTEAYVQGPIVHNKKFKKTRIKFLQSAYGPFMKMSSAEMRNRDELSELKLTKAAHEYERVVLWFEHDSFDQLILARILDYFYKNECPEQLEMVSINHFPGSVRFIGMGQLPADAIRLIWQQRKPVTHEQLALGNKVWLALGEPAPQILYDIIHSENNNQLENMHNALIRHLQEFPSIVTGLSLTEQITLEMLNEESCTAIQLFSKLMRQRDPLPWLGDIMYWYILESMMKVSKPVFAISKNDLTLPWSKRTLSITNTGRDVLNGKLDWLTLGPSERWLGGVKINTRESCWRWDNKNKKIILY